VAVQHDRGRAAEDAAAEHVVARGMRLVERNLRVGKLEIDIVARDGPDIALVEVRARGPTAWQRALGSVGHVKQRRLRDAGKLLWARRFSKWPGVERVRFDVAAVDLEAPGGPRVEYLRAAFV
jgi:putative endonuclease